MVILSSTKVKEAIEKYPELKDVLIDISPKFKKLKNPLIFRLVSRWATFSDVAKLGGLSICELLHRVNRAVGKEKELFESAPECIKEMKREEKPAEEKKPDWIEEAKETLIYDVRNRDDFFLNELIEAANNLKDGQVLKIINSFYPAPLIEMLKESGYSVYAEEEAVEKFCVYIKSREKATDENWLDKKEEFQLLDVRGWKEDPFTTIIKMANDTPPGSGFKLIQIFEPVPLINLIEPLGFETHVEKKGMFEYHIYFYKKLDTKVREKRIEGGRVPLVVQSATPVVYPVIMRILQSKEIMDRVKLEGLKIWDKTEKHLAWIINGQADVSFSAVAAVTKIYQKGLNIKMKAVVVWDNFFILTRGYRAKDFGDLRGHKIYMPLIKSAPPYIVTAHLMKRFGYNPDDFEFVFGDPFGRPEEIKRLLVNGKIDTALLREPEASFALYDGKGDIYESIVYRDLWEKLYPNMGNLPNAGIVFKGEIVEKYPELTEIFLKETKKAIDWLNEHPEDSANTIYDIMGINPEAAKLFLSRAHFEYVDSSEALDRIENYVNVLYSEGYGSKGFNDIRDLFI